MTASATPTHPNPAEGNALGKDATRAGCALGQVQRKLGRVADKLKQDIADATRAALINPP